MKSNLSPIAAVRSDVGPMAVVFNVSATDVEESEDEPPSLVADAEVVEVAGHVVEALQRAGVDARPVALGGPVSPALDGLMAQGVKRIFNLMEGVEGDAGREHEFAAAVGARRMACTGSPATALFLAGRKQEARAALLAAGLPVAEGFVVTTISDLPRLPGSAFPVFVKPTMADGSIGIDQGSVIADQPALIKRVRWLLERLGQPCLVEAWLPGTEVNVVILPPGLTARAAATVIDFSALPPGLHPVVTYDAKWRPASPEYVSRSVPAARVIGGVQLREALRLGLAAFAAIGGRGYGRVDMRGDRDGRFRVIDINPNPDLHPEAGFAAGAASVGVPWAQLIRAIAASARVWRTREYSSDSGHRSATTGRPARTDRGLHTN